LTIAAGGGNDIITVESVAAEFQGTLTLAGGSGDDTYALLAGAWGELQITEAAGGGDDTLAASAAPGDPTLGGTVSYVGESINHIEHQEDLTLDADVLLDGLDRLVTWADSLDNAGRLGQALAVLQGNVGVGLGASLDLADVFDQLRLDIRALVDELGGEPLTADRLLQLLSEFSKSDVTHFDRAIIGDARSPALSVSDSFSFEIGLDSDTPVILTDVPGNADVQGFVDSLNAEIGATALLGRVQAIRTDEGRIGFQLIDASVDTFSLEVSAGADKLGFAAGPQTTENLTKVLGGLGKLDVGVQGTVVPRLSYAADGTPELRFMFRYVAERTSQFNIDLGDAATERGVTFDPATALNVATTLDADLGLGMRLDPVQVFFLDLSRLDLSATNTAADADHTNLSGDLRLGFLGAALADSGGAADPAPAISLFAGVGLDAAVAGLDAFDAADQAAVLGGLAYDVNNALQLELPIQLKPGIPGFEPLVEIRFASDEDAVPFSGRELALVDLEGADDGTAGDHFVNFENVRRFGRIDPSGFVQLVGQTRDFLASIGNSALFTAFDVPFVTEPLSQIARLGDTFFRAVMFDDGRDGKDDADSSKLVTDINEALKQAGLDNLIRAGIDVPESKIVLTAISSTVTGFSLVSEANNELGFGTAQSAARGSAAERLTLSGLVAAPSSGVLAIGDGEFTLTVERRAGESISKTVTVTKAAAEENDGLGNDIEKLLDAANAPTFSTAQELVARLKQLAIALVRGSGDEPKPVTMEFEDNRLTVAFDLSHEFLNLEVPIDFALDLSPLGNIASAGSPKIRIGGDIGFRLTLGIDLNDEIEGSKNLSDETQLTDLRDIDVFTDLIGTDYALTAAASDSATVADTAIALDRLRVTESLEFAKAADGIAVIAESLINRVLNLTSPEGTVLHVNGATANGRTAPLRDVPEPETVGERYVSPRLEFELRIDTDNGAVTGQEFTVVVPEKSYSVATESQFRLRWLSDIEKAIVAAQDSAAVSTIERTGTTWAADGFAAGQRIEISNAELNNGLYTIGSLDGLTLTLVEDLRETGTAANAEVLGPGTVTLPDG
ncbi:MAG TPA: hypothetical protein VKQ06_14155, partial [Gammaproteobacteria bacterium]|nr:hypothetical protein [Gammaproteobacteria bacterium]